MFFCTFSFISLYLPLFSSKEAYFGNIEMSEKKILALQVP